MVSSKAGSRVASLLAALALAFSCSNSEKVEPTGGETHFLTRCEPNTDSCGSKLQCLCGVCTLPCDGRAACQALPAAQCVLSTGTPGCADVASPGHCDVSCVADAECTILSPAHRCEQGTCRAGSVATGGSGGSAGSAGATAAAMAGDAGSAGAQSCVHGDVPANQVLLIGDSFLASSHQITAYLEDLARSAGAVTAGERYRDKSGLVANALALGGNGIADQYSSGVSESAVKVVVMDGGGADALLGSCATADASCPVVAAAAAAARDLLSKMATDKVQHVVYAFYPDPIDTNVRATINALRPLVQTACESAALPCHWLDLRPVFAGHYADYVQADGLNPTAAGSRASAEAIWAVMQQYCVAQ